MDGRTVSMKKKRKLFAGMILGAVCLCGCAGSNTGDGAQNSGVDTQEEAEITKEAINEMKSSAQVQNTPVSIATNVDEEGELSGIIRVTVEDVYVEKEKMTKESTERLADVPDVFVDENGNLKEDYSFVGVKLKIQSDEDVKANLGLFELCGVNGEEMSAAECFYHDGTLYSEDVKDSGSIAVQAGEDTEITIGFFADSEILQSEEFYLVPEFIDTGEDQENYISLTLDEE
jgi:hypothetical protein